MNPVFVVTGTDTGIGKTVFAAALAAALGAQYWKPVQAGLEPETDSQTVARLTGAPVLPEVYCFKLAASPHRAAAAEGARLDPAALTLPQLDMPLVVEGAGGLLVPLDDRTLYIDVFARWGAPLILCARTSLGTINHTLLSLEDIRARNIPLLGIAFLGHAAVDSEATICRLGQARRLGRLDFVSTLDGIHLRAAFESGFSIGDFQ
jgi:dethiobiotin synthetase